MTEPNQQLLDGRTPTITIAGKAWPVPMLAVKQNRIVVPQILKLAPKLMSATDKNGEMSVPKLAEIVTPEFFDELTEIVFLALNRGTPELTKEEFADMEFGMMDMLSSFLTVAQQTGLIKFQPKGAAPAGTVGEAKAGNSQTGIA